jgi:hypothetical protein
MSAGFAFGSNTSPFRFNQPGAAVVTDPFADKGGATGWASDWQGRFNAEESRRGQGASAGTPGTPGTPDVFSPQGFNEAAYLAANPDVAAATRPQTFNPNAPASSFDSNFYLQSNPDVAAAVGRGEFASAADHFARYGINENRAVAAPQFASGAQHFGMYGFGENRSGTNFDESTYLDMNPDVAAAVGRGEFASGAEHFGRHGFGEPRNVFQEFIPGIPGTPGSPGSPGYRPDFSALEAEKNMLNPLLQNQIRQQQAYNRMGAFGQENAMPGGGYTQAGFGQVSGQTNPYGADMGMGQAMLDGAVSGISPDFMSGVYDPKTQQATGVYKPPGTTGGLGGLGGIFQ